MHKFLYTLAATLIMHAMHGTAATISGKVTEAENGNPLPGASVYLEGYNTSGTDTDDDGTYTITMPDGHYTIWCEFMGYKEQKKKIRLRGSATVNFAMETAIEELATVEVSARTSHIATEQVQMSVQHLEVEDLKKMPALLGEQDLIKSFQLMPGVKAESDGGSGFQVRGGEASQNLVLLDNATVNNAGHLLGFFSTFNSDVTRGATLYKGQMPAKYGGRIASVLDIATSNGDLENYRADGSIGLLASKLTVQGPLQKGKSSFLVAGRRTYLDLFLKATEDYKNTKLYFYDLNAKLNFRLGKRDQLEINAFNGTDHLAINSIGSMQWSNTVFSGKWSHRFSETLDLTSEVFYSAHHTENWLKIMDSYYSDNGKNCQTALYEDLTWETGAHTLNAGWQSSYFDVISGEWNTRALYEREQRYAWENDFWIGDEIKVNKRLTTLLGLRMPIFTVLGGSPFYTIDDNNGDILSTQDYAKGDFVKTYTNLEPRASANYRLTQSKSLKAAYAYNVQNIHTIKDGVTSMPMDRFTISTNFIRPETSNQFSLGYAQTMHDREGLYKDAYEFTVEGYYKMMDNVLDYRNGVTSETHIEMDRLVKAGRGRSYGVELNLKKNRGQLTGWLSYTLSKTETKIDGISNNHWYPANTDRRHDVSVVAIYAPNKKWDFSASWIFTSGSPISLPTAKYEINGDTYYYFEGRNNYKTPSYHRLDLNATYHRPPHRHWQGEWSFGLYNAYGRYNTFYISIAEDSESNTGTKAVQTSLFSFVPSVSYRFTFK